MALLTIQNSTFNGVVPNFVAVSASDTFANDGNVIAQVKNSSASSINVVVTSAQICSQGFSHDVTVSVAAGATAIIGPFPPNRFNNENGLVTVTCSATTSVTINVTRVN